MTKKVKQSVLDAVREKIGIDEYRRLHLDDCQPGGDFEVVGEDYEGDDLMDEAYLHSLKNPSPEGKHADRVVFLNIPGRGMPIKVRATDQVLDMDVKQLMNAVAKKFVSRGFQVESDFIRSAMHFLSDNGNMENDPLSIKVRDLPLHDMTFVKEGRTHPELAYIVSFNDATGEIPANEGTISLDVLNKTSPVDQHKDRVLQRLDELNLRHREICRSDVINVLDEAWNQTNKRIQFILREDEVIIKYFIELLKGELVIERIERLERKKGTQKGTVK